MHSTLPG